jgi:uncharacterized repeat protein (TIGR01451 family)
MRVDMWSVVLIGTVTILLGALNSVALGAPPIDLAVSMTAAPEPVLTGGNVTFTAIVTYFDHTPAKNVVLTDTLPNGFTYVSAISTQGTCSQASGIVTCAIGGMSNSITTVTVSIVATAPLNAGGLSSTASVVSSNFDVDPSNNSVTLFTTVRLPMLSVAVTGDGTILGSSNTGGVPADINCIGGTCSAGYPLDSLVSLAAVPPWYSTISWGGCQVTGNDAFSILLAADTTVTATFNPNNNVRLNPSLSLHSRIMDAYAAIGISGSGIIQAQVFPFLERPVFDNPVAVVLEGGMDAAFGPTSGHTTIGPTRISKGKVTFRRIAIKKDT